MAISKFPYGTLHDGRSVDHYTLESGDLKVAVTNYGGIITSILVPDLKGDLVDVVHGFDTLEDYLRGHPYFGCIVGRYADRIAHGQFTLDGFDYKLAKNDGSNHLHAGKKGFDKVLWDVHVVDDSLKFSYTSPEGEVDQEV